jgi:3-methyladenine DNA glycosylase AlkD
MNALLAIARRELRERVDDAYRVQLERLVPGVRAIGVKVPQLRALARELAKHHAIDLEAACALLDAACAGGAREEILLGTMLVARHRRAVANMPWSRVTRWLRAIDNWEVCDLLATSVAAPVVAARLELVDELVRVARAEGSWSRRFAAATAAALNQHGRTHAAEALRVCACLLADREPTVRKATGWAIREVAKRDEVMAFEFLRRHAGELSRTLAREASQKLAEPHRAIVLAASA